MIPGAWIPSSFVNKISMGTKPLPLTRRSRRRESIKYNHATREVPMLRLTRAQVREIDRLSIEEYHIPGIVLMENAARGVAEVAWEMIRQHTNPRVLIICG